MKLKNKLLIFLGIFIFIFIPKNVFAMEVYPFAIGMNNVNFTNSSTSYNARLAPSVPKNNGTYTLMLGIESYDYDSLNLDYSFGKFPYTFIFFQTWNSPDEIGITKSTSCNESCFARDNITLKQVGTDAETGRRRYILVLQNAKWKMDCGTGSGQCVYHIDDQITFTNKSTTTDRAFVFYQVLLSDDISVLNNNAVDVDAMISNANSNRQQVVNAVTDLKNNINSAFSSLRGNDNTNANNIINNQNTNANNIINNQNTNQAQTNQRLDNVNNTLNSDEGVSNNDVSTKTNEWSSKLAGTGPVSNMVLMPITLLNGYVSGLNSTCTPYNLGNLMGTDIILPCVNISNYIGVSLWNVIDVLFSGFMIYAIGKKFVKIFNDFTNLRDNQMDELYGGGK